MAWIRCISESQNEFHYFFNTLQNINLENKAKV
jgi:hypothetical protein